MSEREHRAIDLRTAEERNSEVDSRAAFLATIAEFAAIAREAYCQCYRDQTGSISYGHGRMATWDGGEDGNGRVVEPVWPKLAEMILLLGADPMAYVKAHFQLNRQSRPPTPNMLCSKKSAQIWAAYQTQAEDDARRQLASNINMLESNSLPMIVGLDWPKEKAIRYCLNTTSAGNISPLYRYCRAVQEGFPETVARFYDAALVQYVFQQSTYDTVWGDLIPPDLKRAGHDVREYLVARSQCHRG